MNIDAETLPPLFVPLRDSAARLFGLSARDHAVALAAKARLDPAAAARSGQAVVFGDLGHAWDPAWTKTIAARPGTALVKDGRIVIAHVAADGDAAAVRAAIETGDSPPPGIEVLDADTFELTYHELRKRERPFVLVSDPAHADAIERAYYDASYKGVTDALTLYLWRKPAFYLTRWAARVGMTPNQITMVGALLCVATFFLWMNGWWWSGVAAAFGFMVLDTVDGKLARCTGQSSWWGNIFDHGLDLVHPPFWWWAWAEGLGTIGDPFEQVYEWLIIGAIVGGYVAQRFVEGIFMRRFGMHIHVWRPIDSKFRLITARRNPNMVILVASLIFGRPDVGLEYVAFWTLFSFAFHAVRLAQANDRRLRGAPVTSWLA